MKTILKYSIVWIALFSCHREKVDFLGPGYIFAPEGFHVTSFTANSSSVNFTSSSAVFSAAFTHPVSWILTITGTQSGAVHEIRGISSGLDNVEWKGTHDQATFFRTGETVTATLSFYGTSLSSSLPITIAAAPNYTTCGTFARYGDFETPSLITPMNGWHAFNSPVPIPNVEQGIDSVAVDYTGKPVPSVQGKRYYYIKGKGNQQVFVSGVQYTGPLTPVLPADPDQVWVNMYIYGTGDANTGVELEYQEADFDGTSPGYQGTDDDAFVAKITLDHKGWKLFSFQYSKLTPSLNADFGGSGNKIHEPDRLRSFDLILLKSSKPDSPVEVYFDYPIITVGGPFKPCK